MTATLFNSIWQLLLMAALLLCSAFCSASETAFFNLPRRQVRQFAGSSSSVERLIASLLNDPNRFLTALLFGNMTVNVLYFALSSMLSIRIGHAAGVAAGTFTAFVCFILLLLCGEILPKSLAYIHSKRFCLLASPICFVLLRVLLPLLKAIECVLVQPVVRLLLTPSSRSSPVTAAQFKLLLDTTRRKGLLGEDENRLLAEILKFSFLKVRHVMQPRVEMVACSIHAPSAQMRVLMHQRQRVKIPVYTQSIDNITGVVYLRDLLLNPDTEPALLVKPISFVPEQKSIESLIQFFRTAGEDMAVAVDEYGGIAGCVRFEDVVEQLLGPMEQTDHPPIQPLGPLSYRLAADLSIFDWKDAFGIDLEETHLTTLGGFVAALLGRAPRVGDTAQLKNMKFTVESVKHNRILTVILSLEPILDRNIGQQEAAQ